MDIQTKVMIVTACRCYLGQTVIEVPTFASADRIAGIIRGGGAMTRFIASNVSFDRIEGTGLARCQVTDFNPARHTQWKETPPPEYPLDSISSYLRKDGFIF